MNLDDAQVKKFDDWLARWELLNCSACKRDEMQLLGTTQIAVDPPAVETLVTRAPLRLVVLRCNRCANVMTFDAGHIGLEG